MKKSILLEFTVDTSLPNEQAANELLNEVISMKESTTPEEGVDWIVDIKLYGDGEVVVLTNADEPDTVMEEAGPKNV